MTTGGTGGLVLAAGMGSRVGTPKLRLMQGQESFLHHSVRMLCEGGSDPVVCVVSPGERAWAESEVPHARIVVNGLRSEEMMTSVRVGLDALSACAGVLVLPVDHPLIAGTTIRALVEAGRLRPDAVIKPVFGGRGGHPVLIPQCLFASILSAPAGDTLRQSIASAGVPVIRLEVTDAAVLHNINTPEDVSSLLMLED
jgi:molybdenum cofactor cytidylyltransferase